VLAVLASLRRWVPYEREPVCGRADGTTCGSTDRQPPDRAPRWLVEQQHSGSVISARARATRCSPRRKFARFRATRSRHPVRTIAATCSVRSAAIASLRLRPRRCAVNRDCRPRAGKHARRLKYKTHATAYERTVGGQMDGRGTALRRKSIAAVQQSQAEMSCSAPLARISAISPRRQLTVRFSSTVRLPRVYVTPASSKQIPLSRW